MAVINPKFELSKDTYFDEAYRGMGELSQALQGDAPLLRSWVTQLSYGLGGKYGEMNFPMLALTEGANAQKSVENYEYKYPIMGRPKLTSRIAKVTHAATDKLGLGGTRFKLYFADRWFMNQQILYITKNLSKVYSLRVQADPKQIGNMYEFTVSLEGSPSDYILGSEITTATLVGGGVAKAAIEDSDGVESRSQLGGMAYNMTSFVRSSTKVTGNVQNKVMKYRIKIDGLIDTTSFMDWNYFLADIDFKNKCEYDLWFAKLGKSSTGVFTMYDDNTGKPVSSGAGIDEQITNSSTYSILTHSRLSSTVRDVCFGIGSNEAVLNVWTGTGGIEAVSDAMMEKLKSFGFTVSSDKFVSGQNSGDMIFGSFFKGFRHVDGQIINFMKHPMFDRGSMAQISDIHPTSGLPMSSHAFYFVDQTTYDGESNIQYVYEKGREYQKYAVNGNVQILGYPSNNVRSSAKDTASIHCSKSQGVQMFKTAGCFKLFCDAA